MRALSKVPSGKGRTEDALMSFLGQYTLCWHVKLDLRRRTFHCPKLVMHFPLHTVCSILCILYTLNYLITSPSLPLASSLSLLRSLSVFPTFSSSSSLTNFSLVLLLLFPLQFAFLLAFFLLPLSPSFHSKSLPLSPILLAVSISSCVNRLSRGASGQFCESNLRPRHREGGREEGRKDGGRKEGGGGIINR